MESSSVIGKTLAHYHVTEKIGAGGMGAVYRAHDTSLGRDVALKVLPETWSRDPERIARFEREARTLASLHHPNIATIFGFHEVDGVRFLAMELAEGADLAERLARGPVPVDEALDIAVQVAEGLEEAHERGIVHRDLKPANVKAAPDGRVKVLDFGLAQAFRGESVEEAASHDSPTVVADLTRAGTILGTAAYMSPEQARGKPVDRRTDIWAFGCLTFELLAGRRAFPGDTAADLLAAVLHHEPDLEALPGDTPASARDLLTRCLRKDPRQRLRDIGDARIALEEVRGRIASPVDAATAPGRGAGRRLVLPLVAAVVVGGLLGVLVGRRSTSGTTPPAERLAVAFATTDMSTDRFALMPMISPAGDAVLYVGGGRLRIRSLDRVEDREVPGSAGTVGQCWSPDSKAVAFERDRRLWTWRRDAMESQPICALPGSGSIDGAVWMSDGKIYFVMYAGDGWAVPAIGGEPELVLPREEGDFDFHLPAALPGEKEFVAVAHRPQGKQHVFVFSVEDGRRYPILEMSELSAVAYSPTGHLLLTRNWITIDTWAVRFSPESRKVSGEPFPVDRGMAYPSVAQNGDLVWTQSDRDAQMDLLWVSPDGRWERVVSEPIRGLDSPSVSPDGRRIAYSAVMDDNRDIWVMDLDRGTRRRITTGPQNDQSPWWSPDGRWIYFVSWVPGKDTLLRARAEGGSDPEFVAEASEAAPLPDGRTVIVANESEGEANMNLYSLDLASRELEPWLVTPFAEGNPAVSPDGRWLAYASNESGRPEVHLQDIAGEGTTWLISTEGGSRPMWDPSGAVLYYRSDSALMKVAVGSGAVLTPGRPERVFPESGSLFDADQPGFRIGFGVAPGPRFLVSRQSPADPHAGILFVRGWKPPEK